MYQMLRSSLSTQLRTSIVSALGLVLIPCQILLAGDFEWTGATDNRWDEPGNWNQTGGSDDGSNGYPDGTDNATFLVDAGPLTGVIGCAAMTVDAVATVSFGDNGAFTGTVTVDGVLDLASFDLNAGTNTVTGSGTITVSTGIMTAGLLNVATLTASGSASMDVSGDWSVTTFTASTSTVTLTGSTSSVTTTTTFNRLVVSKSAQSTTVSMAANVNVNDTLRISTGILATSTFTLSGTGGGNDGLRISNGATLRLEGTNGFPTTFDNLDLSSGSNIDYAGTTQTVSNTPTYANLRISASGTKTLGGNLTLNGNLTMTAGTFTLGSNTINASGGSNTLTMTGSPVLQIGGTNSFPSTFETTTLSGGTVEYNGTNQSVAVVSPSYNSVTFTGAGTKTAAGALTLTGTVTINAGSIFDAGSFTHAVGGDWNENSTGMMTSTGTINFTGAAVTVFDSAAFNHVTFSGGGAVTMAGALRDTIYGNLTLSNNTTMSVSTALNMLVRGNWDASGGTFSATAGTVTFINTSGGQNVSASSFFNVTFSNAGTKTATGSWDVNGALIISGGASVNGGAFSHTVAGAWTSDGTFSGSGTVTLDGGAQTISGTSVDFYNLATASAGAKTISAGVQVNIGNSMTIANNTTLVVNSVNNLVNAGTASLIMNSGTPTATLQINVSGGFPTGFTSYSFGTGSTTTYNINGDATVVGGASVTYQNLTVTGASGTKTASAGLNVDGNFTLGGNNTLDLAGFDHTFAGNLVLTGTATIQNTGGTGTFTLDADDAAQTITLNTGTFTVNNFHITQNAPLAARTKTLTSATNALVVTGNFSATNVGGDVANTLTVVFPATQITGSGGSNGFSLGSNVILSTAGSMSLFNSLATFETVSLDVASTVNYLGNAPADQFIAVRDANSNTITYGNLSLNRGGGTGSTRKILPGSGNILDVNGNFVMNQNINTITFFDSSATNETRVAGNWTKAALPIIQSLGTVTFDGTTQTISVSTFFNVTYAGSGTKTLSGNQTITGDLTISNGVTVSASTFNLTFSGSGSDFVNSGTGVFTQTTGTTTFSSTGPLGHSVTTSAASQFGNMTLTSDFTVTFNSDAHIFGNVVFTQDSAVLDISGRTIRVDGNWTRALGTTCTVTGSTLDFGGSNTQTISVFTAGGNVFNHVSFTGAATKRTDDVTAGGIQAVALDFNGDVTIGPGATFAAGGASYTVGGSWSNSGSFTSTGTITFDGAAQNIGSSTFSSIVCGGTGTKTLQGNITLAGALTINDNVTLDVSSSNYSITVGTNWTNNVGTNGGVFEARNGKVTFTGTGANTILTGDDGTNTANKNFYQVDINKTAGTATVTTYRMDVDSNFVIVQGTFATGANNFTVGGHFINNGTFTHNVNSVLTLDDAAGTDSIRTGASSLTGRVVFNAGASYYLSSHLTSTYAVAANQAIRITSGTLDLNGKTLTVADSIILTGGAIEVDSAARLQIAANMAVLNEGGTVRIVGTSVTAATVTRSGAAGGYTVTQTSGTFEARHYVFDYLRTTGITLSGGTVNSTNNFSNGTFSNHQDGSVGSNYIDFTSISWTSTDTVKNLVLNTGPDFNISRSGGNIINIQDATGNLAGEAFDNDGAGFITWVFPNGITWDRGAGTDRWNEPLNWSSNTLPGGSDFVILDHTTVAATITITIDSVDAACGNLSLSTGGGNPVSLIVNGRELSIGGDLNIGTGCTLTQTTATDTITISGNWSNSGTHNNGSSAVVMNGGGTKSITSGVGGNGTFYDLVILAPGATYQLNDSLRVTNTFMLTAGTLDVTASNRAVVSGGNWSNTGTFTPRAGTVRFNRAGTSTQTISGGPFYDVIMDNPGGLGTATKQITSNLDIDRSVVLNAGTVMDGGTNTIFLGSAITANTTVFTNNSSATAFQQTGSGTLVIDNAAFRSDFPGGAFITAFNNLTLSGAGTKRLVATDSVNGDLTVASGSGAFDLQTFTILTRSATKTFTVSGNATLTIGGANSFPANFATVSLNSGSTVSYNAATDQSIAGVIYGNLALSGGSNKTALGDIEVAGTLTVTTSGTNFDLSGFDFTVTGGAGATNDMNFAAGTVFTAGSGTVTHNGDAWNIDADITAFNHLVMGGSGAKTLFGNLTINGDLTVNSGVTLAMGTFQVNGTVSRVFTMSGSSTLTCGIVAPDSAFPKSFGTNTLSPTSTVSLNVVGNQIIKSSGVTYGNLTLTAAGSTKTANGPLTIAGNVNIANAATTFEGGSFNHSVGGNWSLTGIFNSTGTVTFNGTTQSITFNGADTLYFNSAVFSGSGTKTLGDGNDVLDFNGNITINNGSTVTTARNIAVAGNWANSGTFTATAGTINFDGTSQSINPGVGSSFNNMAFTNGSTKTFVTNGVDVNGTFTVTGVTVDMGALTHTFGGSITNTGTWTTTNARLIFDGAGQTITSGSTLTARSVFCQGTGTKTMGQDWSIDSLTIANGVTLSALGGTPDYDITLTGSWINNGTFTTADDTVRFESNNTTAQSIFQPTSATANNNFNVVLFNTAQTSARRYSLTTPSTTMRGALAVGTGAMLDLSGRILIIGNGSTHTVDGILEVDAGAVLRFNNTAGNSTLNVNAGGMLTMAGSSGSNIATLTRSAGTNRTAVTVNGILKANYYLAEFISDAGFNVTSSAVLDADSNLSNGTWTNINTATGSPRRYLILDADATGIDTIRNVTFNFSGTPTAGTHFNVTRTTGAGTIGTFVFGGTIDGNLNGLTGSADVNTYESDPDAEVRWPITNTATWTGNVDRNWNVAGNWSTSLVPDGNTDVTIPSVVAGSGNAPKITSANATCRNLTITDGNLTIENGFDLLTGGDISIGSTGAGVLAVASSSSEITVGGSWTRGASGGFSNGGGRVTFTATTGTKTITPLTSSFSTVVFNGSGTFSISGSFIDVNDTLRITNGSVSMATANHSLFVGGHFVLHDGTFNDTSTTGRLVLDGANQSVNGGVFYRVWVVGSATKTFNGNVRINDTLRVFSTIAGGTGSYIDMNGPVVIATGGTFNDGGEDHTFAGNLWTQQGTYTGTGSVTLDGGAQTINAATFNNLIVAGTGTKTLGGNLTITGDLTVSSTLDLGSGSGFAISGTGTNTLIMNAASTMTIRGPANFPASFESYTVDATSTTNYSGTGAQAIGAATYGNLVLNSNSTKTLAGDITVLGNFNMSTGSLDVSTNNYTIYVGGNWTNSGGAVFTPRTGEVVFNGTGTQTLNTGGAGAGKKFYKLGVAKSAGSADLNAALDVDNNLSVSLGTFTNQGNNINIGGDLLVTGTFTITGGASLVTFDGAGGSYTITSNNAQFQNLTFDGSGSTFTLQDGLTVLNDFTITAGIFDGNGQLVNFGTAVGDVLTIDGVYNVGPGGTLALGAGATLTVNSGGDIRVVGTSGNIATVTRNLIGGAGTYGFQVSGTIHALNYVFEFMNTSGIQVNSGATIDADSNFSNGTFTNGAVNGTLLRIETNQTMTISNISFPLNPGGSAKNVAKISTSTGTVTFDPYTGSFGGESFENDAFGLLVWPVPVSLTWDGSANTDWFNKNNWTVSSGPDTIPYAATDVIIANVTNQPIITSPGAICNNMTINTSATLTLTTAAAVDTDLTINGNLTLNGTLTVTGTNDRINAGGDWTKAGGGTFNNGGSTVFLTAASGTKIINNGTAAFYNLTTSGNAVFRLGANTTIANDLTIGSGTFDVSASNFTLSVGGNWSNTGGTFNGRAGTVTFNATGAVTKSINAGSSSFFSLSFNGDASTVFQLGNTLTTTGSTSILSGTLDLNGQTFNHGDGTGDGLTVTGTLSVDGNAFLRMSANATMTVNSGGRFEAVGTSDVAVATVTRQSSGTYSFVVSSGATMAAQYYLFEYMNTSGIQVTSGSIVDATDDFRNGVFSNGAAGGRYWLMEGSFADALSHTLPNVTFNGGPDINVSRTDGALTDTVYFQDPSGSLGNYLYEDDILPASASDGLLRWISTATLYTWVGSLSTDWNDPLNWDVGAVPSNSTTHDVIIPDVTNDPVLGSGLDGVCRNITIQSGGQVTIQNNLNLTIGNNMDNSGTLTVSAGSASAISVGNTWTNSGTFSPGSSTVTLTAASGTKTITIGTGSFNNLTINGGATFQPSAAIDINGNFTISAGTFDVTSSSFQVNVGGNWTNSATFTSRSGTVIFDGTGAQSINTGGTGAGQQFYNFRIMKASGTATLTGNLDVNNDLTLSTGTFANGAFTIQVGGNWNNTGATFTAGSGLVTFDGTGTRTLASNNQPFESLTINKTGGGQVTINTSISVNGNLTVTAGTLFANNRTIAFGNNVADAMSVTGTLNLDAGSILQLFGGTTTTVNSGGSLRAVGTSASQLATISRRTSGNYGVTVNGTIHARFATIEYTGGNGITVTSLGSIDATNNFSNVTFQNGTGTAYLTLQNAQSLSPSGTRFDSAAASRVTSTVVHSGSGQVSFVNYTGTMAGARYEGSDGSSPIIPYGRVRWSFNETQSVPASTTARFGNDVVITSGAANLGSTTVVLVSDTLSLPNGATDATVGRYYEMIPTNGGTATTVRFYYGQFEIAGETEASMNIWQRRAGIWTLITPSVRDVVNNFVEASSYAFSAGVRDTIVLSDATDEVSLPVELAFFEGMSQEGRMVLEWRTESEINNLSWIIEKKEIIADEWEMLNDGSLTIDETEDDFEAVTDLRGQGTKATPTDYKYIDTDVKAGHHYAYRLADVSLTGARTYHSPIVLTVDMPKKFALKQNYPNPFNPTTTIRYELPVQARVTIKIYNILGQEVFTLVDRTVEAGFHEAMWKGLNKANHAVSSGVYIYRLTAQALNGKDTYTQTKKMMIVK